MKKYFWFLIICIFLNNNLKAQGEEEIRYGEIYIPFISLPVYWAFTVKINSIGTVWDHNHSITLDYSGGEVYYSISITPNTHYYHASDLSWSYIGNYPPVSLGLYEIAVWEGANKKAWFFIDYRTSHFPFCTTLQVPDITLEYNVSDKEFYFINSPIGLVENGEFFTMWELKEAYIQKSEGLEDYWNNCLVVFDNGDAHPRFAWGPYPGYSNNYFKIYKKKGTPNFILYDSTASTTYVDVNEDILYGPPHINEGYIYYKITSVGYPTENPQSPVYESSFSNTVNIISILDPIEKRINFSRNEKKHYLYQNFPNPFNPTTYITWESPENNFVMLKVFDILGKEVCTLVNEYKEAGVHQVKFDGTEFPSGVYLCRIQSGSYSETMKLILQK